MRESPERSARPRREQATQDVHGLLDVEGTAARLGVTRAAVNMAAREDGRGAVLTGRDGQKVAPAGVLNGGWVFEAGQIDGLVEERATDVE